MKRGSKVEESPVVTPESVATWRATGGSMTTWRWRFNQLAADWDRLRARVAMLEQAQRELAQLWQAQRARIAELEGQPETPAASPCEGAQED